MNIHAAPAGVARARLLPSILFRSSPSQVLMLYLHVRRLYKYVERKLSGEFALEGRRATSTL